MGWRRRAWRSKSKRVLAPMVRHSIPFEVSARYGANWWHPSNSAVSSSSGCSLRAASIWAPALRPQGGFVIPEKPIAPKITIARLRRCAPRPASTPGTAGSGPQMGAESRDSRASVSQTVALSHREAEPIARKRCRSFAKMAIAKIRIA